MKKIELGNIVRDRVTGFKGMANCRTLYFNGCVRIGVQPQSLLKGKTLEAEYFDEAQLEIISQGLAPKAVLSGGPERAPKSMQDAPAF